jgi:EF-P beta-lysylation protein EpmB
MTKISAIVPRTELVLHSEHHSLSKEQPARHWQAELSHAVTDVSELLRLTGNKAEEISPINPEALDFPLRVPRPYIDRIIPGNINDPLLQQVLPLSLESKNVPGYSTDPLDETATNMQPGIIHKYTGRVLLILTGACAINCRYCFRRHFAYSDNQNSKAQWLDALKYIEADPSITEVIYSGGDPLLNSDKQLGFLTQAIAGIAHVKRLRIHTRLPVVIPRRITPDLLKVLAGNRLKTALVLHINHPNEIDQQVINALGLLRQNDITLLNQSVLLNGINNRFEVLARLSESLYEAGILPYYLHLLDKVKGAAHFDTSQLEAQKLVGQLTAILPGYLVPKLVTEIPGQVAKTPLMPIF